MCNDPDRQIITILLTNRVYPLDSPFTYGEIRFARQRFNNMVQAVVDGAVAETGARPQARVPWGSAPAHIARQSQP